MPDETNASSEETAIAKCINNSNIHWLWFFEFLEANFGFWAGILAGMFVFSIIPGFFFRDRRDQLYLTREWLCSVANLGLVVLMAALFRRLLSAVGIFSSSTSASAESTVLHVCILAVAIYTGHALSQLSPLIYALLWALWASCPPFVLAPFTCRYRGCFVVTTIIPKGTSGAVMFLSGALYVSYLYATKGAWRMAWPWRQRQRRSESESAGGDQ